MPVHKKIKNIAAGRFLPFALNRLRTLKKHLGPNFVNTIKVKGVTITVSRAGIHEAVCLSGGFELVLLAPLTKGKTAVLGNVIGGKAKWSALRSFPISIEGISDPAAVSFGYGIIRVSRNRFFFISLENPSGYATTTDRLKAWFSVAEGDTFVDRPAPVDHQRLVWDGTSDDNVFTIVQLSPISYAVASASFKNISSPPVTIGALPLVLSADAALEENFVSGVHRLVETTNDIMTGGGGASVGIPSTYVYSVTGRKYTLVSMVRTFDSVVRININTTSDFLSTNVATLSLLLAPDSNPPNDSGFISIASVGNGEAIAAIPLRGGVETDYFDFLRINSSGPTAWGGRVIIGDLPGVLDGRNFGTAGIMPIGVGAAYIIVRAGPNLVFGLRTFDFGVTWAASMIIDFSAGLYHGIGGRVAVIKPRQSTPFQEAELATFISFVGGDIIEYRSFDSGVTWTPLRTIINVASVFGGAEGVLHNTNIVNLVGGD